MPPCGEVRLAFIANQLKNAALVSPMDVHYTSSTISPCSSDAMLSEDRPRVQVMVDDMYICKAVRM